MICVCDENNLNYLLWQIWDQKIREARVSYELSVWFYKNPVKDLAEVEADYTTEAFKVSV